MVLFPHMVIIVGNCSLIISNKTKQIWPQRAAEVKRATENLSLWSSVFSVVLCGLFKKLYLSKIFPYGSGYYD